MLGGKPEKTACRWQGRYLRGGWRSSEHQAGRPAGGWDVRTTRGISGMGRCDAVLGISPSGRGSMTLQGSAWRVLLGAGWSTEAGRECSGSRWDIRIGLGCPRASAGRGSNGARCRDRQLPAATRGPGHLPLIKDAARESGDAGAVGQDRRGAHGSRERAIRPNDGHGAPGVPPVGGKCTRGSVGVRRNPLAGRVPCAEVAIGHC